MDRVYGTSHYTSQKVSDHDEGYDGYELWERLDGKNQRVARIVFWDALGRFYVETFHTMVPLEILDALIAETKENIKYY